MASIDLHSYSWRALGAVPPPELVDARLEAHFAVQVAAACAESLLEAAPDYSHGALSWFDGHQALAGRLIPLQRPFRAALRITDLHVLLLDADASVLAEIPLVGLTLAEAQAKLRAAVRELHGGVPPRPIRPTEYTMPPHDLAGGGRFMGAPQEHLRELARWYANASVMLRLHAGETEGASPVRCWPHHFDIATLTVLDPDEPDAEKARSIGVGFSPGDESIAEPYVYVLPWPHLAPDDLPALDGGGRWHTEGFVAAVLPGSVLVEGDAAAQRARWEAFVTSAVRGARARLGVDPG